MRYLELTLPTPEENLACDEALLEDVERGADEILRVWEPRQHFVVVGYANSVAVEVNRAECDCRRIPVLRRCTGGGTVLQGPGCLNYSLFLKTEAGGPLHSITATNRFVMERIRAALQPLVGRPVVVKGYTDLAIGVVKFSGNAQRRKKRSLLFHGSFLLDLDLTLLTAVLPLPSRQPEYRLNRGHADFVVNLGIPAAAVKVALRGAWAAVEECQRVPWAEIAALARDKYVTTEWNFKF